MIASPRSRIWNRDLSLQLFERRRRGRAKHKFLGQRFPQPARQSLGGKLSARLVLRADRDQHCMSERREITALAELQLLLEIPGEIVMPRELNGRTKRRVGLDENFARRFAAARPSGHLGEELEGALSGPEIGQVERQIGVDDSDEGDVREMQPFAIICVPTRMSILPDAKSMERFAIGILAHHGVGVHSPNDCFREDGRDVRLHFFRAEAGVDERVLAAFRAALRHRCAVTAKVTTEMGVSAMKGKRDAAIRTFARLAAVAAEERGGESAAVQEQDRLLMFFEAFAQLRCATSPIKSGPLSPSAVPAADRQSGSRASGIDRLVG